MAIKHVLWGAASGLAGVGLVTLALVLSSPQAAGSSPPGSSDLQSSTAEIAPNSGDGPNYPRNANGQTYGSELLANDPSQRPDLILVVASNGLEGYVATEELYPPLPGNPEEAIAMNKSANDSHTVPV